MKLEDDPLAETYARQRRAAQCKLDTDLAKSLRNASRQVEKRSSKLGIVMRIAADRIEAMRRELDRMPAPGPQADNQPASTPIN